MYIVTLSSEALLALVEKYYGHQNHRLCFAGSELRKWNADVITRGRKDLVDSYTQEEIKVKFILDCLFAESKNQRSKLKQQPLMSSFGHSVTRGTKTVCH